MPSETYYLYVCVAVCARAPLDFASFEEEPLQQRWYNID